MALSRLQSLSWPSSLKQRPESCQSKAEHWLERQRRLCRSGNSSYSGGILKTSGLGFVAVGTNGLAPTLDRLLDLNREFAVDNADVARCGYLTNAQEESVLAKAKDSQSQYLRSPYGTELGRSQIAGRRFEVSNNVPSNLTKVSGSNLSAVIYGNFAALLLLLQVF
ncbi:phage major capsid protein [Synechococcus sp. WH 8109]|uniref:phage major capsid protein n=1 Tax=Synechococcus sp. WH 8109 TaxID=166314 RepID=UPI00046D5D80|nr:phage major capsid protein [Synechococcus sp. WH 8109]